MKRKDQEAIAKLYTESWDDNPYIDDVEQLKQHQSNVDKESGRIQHNLQTDRSFDEEPEDMQDPKLDSRFENAKNAKIAAIFATSKRAKQGDHNAKVILSILKLSFKSWARDLNLLNDPEVKAALNGENIPNFKVRDTY
jgi:hypothetical protein